MPKDLESRLRAEIKAEGKDPDLIELERLAADLHGKGHEFRIEAGKLVLERHATDRDQTRAIDIGKTHIRLGVISDTHGGSHYEQLTALRTFYRYADGLEPDPVTGEPIEPVDGFIHAGDWTQGSDRMHLDQPYQVHAHGADQQVGYVIGTYPRSARPDVKTYGISGNHDDSFLKDGGINVLRRIADAREDIEYLGQTGAYFSVGPLNSYVVHPRGGMPYAKSYRLQKFIEGLPISRAINLLLMGHLHSYALVQEHGVTAMLIPCFQRQYGWMASGALHPAVGGVILDVWLDDEGSTARVRHEFVRFQHVMDDDWDRDVSHEVGRGWTPDGLAV